MSDMKGKVYLAGAGPGDAGLLTLKTAELIKTADVVVYDRLVGKDVIGMIPESTEKIDVGKNAGSHPVPQHEINRILAELALEGRKVLRLKGGDPFVFGRGGEELEELISRGIEFEVVPGITSSIAAPAYAGIPVTHRDYCSSVHLITGHARAGSEVDIDYEALVRLKGTLVFMMSVSTAGQIARGLISAGMDENMPCAVIENGTRPDQRKFVSVLSDMEDMVNRNEVVSPAVIMVGKVCGVPDSFDWYDHLPLKGRRILVTQPASRSSRLSEELKKLGAETILYPCIRTSALRPIDPPFEEYSVLVFTSAEGVKSFCGWLLEEGRDMRALAGRRIACIGSATAAALEGYGLAADFVPQVYSGEKLGEEMLSAGFIGPEDSLLLLRTTEGSDGLLNVLNDSAIRYMDYPVYETAFVSHDEKAEDSDIVTFTSRSCVEGFVRTQRKDRFDGVKALCIGLQTEEAALRYGFDTYVSDAATIESMIGKAREIL